MTTLLSLCHAVKNVTAHVHVHVHVLTCTARLFVAISLPEEIHGFMCNHRSGPIPVSFMNTVPSLPLPPSLPPSPSSLPPSLPPVRQKGESVTGYYRFLTHYGHYVWLQIRGMMMVDRRTGKPSYVVCMHFIIRYSVHVNVCVCVCVCVCVYTCVYVVCICWKLLGN